MKPKKCNLCNKKLKKILIVANKIFGDKTNRRKFYHCLNCDIRFMYPSLNYREEIKFYKKEFEKFMSKDQDQRKLVKTYRSFKIQ